MTSLSLYPLLALCNEYLSPVCFPTSSVVFCYLVRTQEPGRGRRKTSSRYVLVEGRKAKTQFATRLNTTRYNAITCCDISSNICDAAMPKVQPRFVIGLLSPGQSG